MAQRWAGLEVMAAVVPKAERMGRRVWRCILVDVFLPRMWDRWLYMCTEYRVVDVDVNGKSTGNGGSAVPGCAGMDRGGRGEKG